MDMGRPVARLAPASGKQGEISNGFTGDSAVIAAMLLMMMQDATRQQRWHERRRGYGYSYGRPGYGRPYGPPPRHGYYRRHDRW